MKKLTVYTVGGLAVALGISGLTGCGASTEARESDDTIVPQWVDEVRRVPVNVVTVEPTTFVEYGEYVGEARGVSEVRLTVVADGRVAEIYAAEGDDVSVGDSLAAIDSDRVRVKYDTAVLKERLAREASEREQRFLQQGNSFQLKVDQAYLAWLEAQGALLDAKRLKESALAVSPIAGTVVRRYIAPQDDLESGDPTFDVADLSRIRVSVDVPESDIAGVRSLGGAEVSFAANPGVVFHGEVTSFARTRSETTLGYEVDIEFENPDGVILAGQTARIRLALREDADAIALPSRVVVTRGDIPYVFVVDGDAVREIPVTIGMSSDTETVITSGVQPGDRVVLDGLNRLADGAPITVLD